MEELELVDNVIKIAGEAGSAIQRIYKEAEDIEIESKADDSPLTLADRTANEIICKGLENLSVKYPVISEENKEVPYEERKDYEYFWMVDPLDGTKEFIKKNGEFTVNIALIHNQRVILGVVYASDLDEMYWGIKGVGAYQVKDGENVRLTTAPFSIKDAQLGVVCSRSHLNDETQNFVNGLEQPNLVAKGSSLKFISIAKGEAHVYPRLAPTMEWDTAAAQVILEEAGGKVLDKESQQPLLYNKEVLTNPHFIAYGAVEG